jgi:heat shock protein HslJ
MTVDGAARTRSLTHIWLAAVCLVTSVTACADNATGPSRTGGTWTATSIPGIESLDPVDAPQIQFTLGGTLVGGAGCTDFMAPYGIDGDMIVLGPMQTQPHLPCPDERVRSGAAFFRILSAVDTISGGNPGDTLTLSGSAGAVVFSHKHPTPAP